MRRYGIYVALLLVLIANAVVLGGVQYNRSGTPEATVELTERELHVGYAHDENSSVSLRLNWNRMADRSEWFDRKRLEELGYDLGAMTDADDRAGRRYRTGQERKAYAVLEYDGPAWQTWLADERQKLAKMQAEVESGKVTAKTLESAQKRLVWNESNTSRLLAVDVGRNPEALRQRYTDRSRYIITPALVRLNYRYPVKEKGVVKEPARVYGSISRILTDSIHVPGEMQAPLAALQRRSSKYRSPVYYEGVKQAEPQQPHYRVTLVYGKRFEPWVSAVRTEVNADQIR